MMGAKDEFVSRRRHRQIPRKLNFGSDVAETFNRIQKSVPGYNLSHQCIELMSDPFIKDNGLIVELGCSTGSLLFRIIQRHSHRRLTVKGYDIEEPMIDQCKMLQDKQNIPENINCSFQMADITQMDLDKGIDLCAMTYTFSLYRLQYDGTWYQKYILTKQGGGLFLFEKEEELMQGFKTI